MSTKFESEKLNVRGSYTCTRKLENGKLEYKLLYQNLAEDDMGYYLATAVFDEEPTSIDDFIGKIGISNPLTSSVVEEFVSDMDSYGDLIKDGIEMDAEVYGERYATESTYRGNDPFAPMEEAVNIAQNEIQKKR